MTGSILKYSKERRNSIFSFFKCTKHNPISSHLHHTDHPSQNKGQFTCSSTLLQQQTSLTTHFLPLSLSLGFHQLQSDNQLDSAQELKSFPSTLIKTFQLSLASKMPTKGTA